jgi:plastocyanin
MDRVYRQKIQFVILTALIAAPCGAPPARAGTTGPYPESRFGHPPARPDTGRPSSLSAYEADEQDSGGYTPDGAETNLRPGSRSPAGMVFGAKPKAITAQPTHVAQTSSSGPVTPADETQVMKSEGTAAANLNPESENMAIRRKGVQEIALIAGDLGFFPKTFFVSRDVPVRLFVTGASKNTLCIMMDSFQVRKQVKTRAIEEITFTPSTPGQYRFYCPINGMEGKMIVKELVSSAE